MFNPISTYRIQFNKDFTFKNLDAMLPFLIKLGVKTIYASPVFAAVPGSTHGYDVTNPYEINPEIGTEEELYQLSNKLKQEGMSWIQDIVPNHMAFHHDNTWLMDVLEKGSVSLYSQFFDVTWSNQLFHGKLMVPFLDGSLEEVTGRKELQIVYEKQRLLVKYFDNYFSLNAKSYKTVFSAMADFPPVAVQLWLDQLGSLIKIEDPVQYSLRWHELLLQSASLMSEDETGDYLIKCIDALNNNATLFLEVINAQNYQLCSWQETNDRINYRRFFTVNGLICLNMHSPKVFEQYHKKIKLLLNDGIFQGLRVDHVDGLGDPKTYLERLRMLAGDDTYIIVEKILEPGEELPGDWPIQGTTGYDFLAVTNNLFTQNNAEQIFTQIYDAFLRDKRTVPEKIREKKSLILRHYMGGELDNLYHLLLELNLLAMDGLKAENVKDAIAELLIQCPVYRYYGNKFPLDKTEADSLRALFKSCIESKPALSTIFSMLEDVLLRKTLAGDLEYNERAIEFYKRCMQFTGPLMAKGVEDTLMYTFNRFIAHNEVGDSPEYFGLTTMAFHRTMMERQRRWPLALNTTATHDTKRGEDVRMRLNVLTDLAEEWMDLLQEWRKLNADIKIEDAPDANDEYFIYQTLVGTYPSSATALADYNERLDDYLTKSLRESKRNSSWAAPDEHYEEHTKNFTKILLDKNRPFWKSFQSFQGKIGDFGMLNSLSQVLLKFTCPGIPDLYQGTVSWDLSMVDPDNRRPVDYEHQAEMLALVVNPTKKSEEHIRDLWATRNNANIKLWLIQLLLKHRNEATDVFLNGFYVPLRTSGKYKDNIVAFARQYKDTWYVAAVPLYIANLCEKQQKEISDIDWGDTSIIIPAEAPQQWEHCIVQNKKSHTGKIFIGDVFQEVPLALLKLEHATINRSSGILMPIASLPSAFGIGDFGKKARDFADFLVRSGQTFWQILPLNPVTNESDYSPYSSHSAMACNPLYISLEMLAADGLLQSSKLKAQSLPSTDVINYDQAEAVKCNALNEAWENFKQRASLALKKEFDEFLEEQSYWVQDFALYEVIKKNQQNRCWYEWPSAYKFREKKALDHFCMAHADDLKEIKWQQFIVLRQWKKLKEYCNNLGLKIFGDLPFYVNYDSVDVWSHPEIFALEGGEIKSVAGVPPDYFNSSGQLWGMPVFRWDVLKKQEYGWWIDRIRKNTELYDLLRLDHFRAFANYWEVPAQEENAINGKWSPGPREDFFTTVQNKLGHLPFVAEDLGQIDMQVFELRDKVGLFGMKVLQFAFDKDMPKSIYIPHEYTPAFVVYTGTHDNNTTRGWYRKDTTPEHRERLAAYFSKKITEKNIAEEMIRLAYSSVAKMAITPLQDVLNLDEKARVNMPSTRGANWKWRLRSGVIKPAMENKLRSWAIIFGRF